MGLIGFIRDFRERHPTLLRVAVIVFVIAVAVLSWFYGSKLPNRPSPDWSDVPLPHHR
jgi:hypothetical protein